MRQEAYSSPQTTSSLPGTGHQSTIKAGSAVRGLSPSNGQGLGLWAQGWDGTGGGGRTSLGTIPREEKQVERATGGQISILMATEEWGRGDSVAKRRQDKTTPSMGGGQERFHQHLGLSLSWGEGALTAGLSTETMPPATEKEESRWFQRNSKFGSGLRRFQGIAAAHGGCGCTCSQLIKTFKTVFSFLMLGVLSSVHPLIIRGGGWRDTTTDKTGKL